MNIIKNQFKRIAVPALMLVFSALALAGCGKKVSEGYWELSEITEGKTTVHEKALEDYGLDESYIVTEKNGDGYAVLFGIPADFTTNTDKGTMAFETGNVEYKLSGLVGKKLVLSDKNVTMVFKKSKDDAPQKPAAVSLSNPSSEDSSKVDELLADAGKQEQSQSLAEDDWWNQGEWASEIGGDSGSEDGPYKLSYNSPREYFEGNWYGWWKLDPRTDFWKQLDGDVFDVLCKVEMQDDTFGVMTLWDAGMPYENPIARMPVIVSDKGYDPKIGEMQSDAGGKFLDGEVTNTTWSTDPGTYDWKNYMMITGTYIDGNGNEAFDYVFHLKKWGDDWSDFSQKPPQFSWYEKEIEAGNPMPDTLPE